MINIAKIKKQAGFTPFEKVHPVRNKFSKLVRGHGSRTGFTLVELMLVAVITAILALTIGTMLVYIFVAWRNNSDQVELQRDASIAMDMISRAIRPASNYQIQIPDPAHSPPSIKINTKSFYLVSGVGSNSLYYDPDTTVPSNEVELIRNRVTNLQFVNNVMLKSIVIDMDLAEGKESLAIDQETFYYRN